MNLNSFFSNSLNLNLKNDEWMQPNWHHVLHTLQSNLKASHVTVKTLVVMFIGLYMV